MVDERYVRVAEGALGVSFPTSYRLAMMKSNGGAVATEDEDWESVPVSISDDSDRKRLARPRDATCKQLAAPVMRREQRFAIGLVTELCGRPILFGLAFAQPANFPSSMKLASDFKTLRA
jgi:hypothetical protein